MPTNLLTRAWQPIAASLGVITVTAALTLTGAGIANAATAPKCTGGTCTITFSATGAPETWAVPAGVTSVTATVNAAAGGAGAPGGGLTDAGQGGLGGALTATVPVAAGETLTTVVGAKGADGVTNSTTPAQGGYPRGGTAGTIASTEHGAGGAGGGGSFLFGSNALLLAAGGGGGGTSGVFDGPLPGGEGGATGDGQDGGNGGGIAPAVAALVPARVAGVNGLGGTTTAPGAGGDAGFVGGAGGSAATSSPAAISAGGAGATNPGGSNWTTAGGGGSGFYGGGGGGTDVPGGISGAGGGGSGFVSTTATAATAQPAHAGSGSITITYADVPKTVTTTTVTASSNPTAGTPVTLIATVSPAPANGGVVTFKDGQTVLGTASVTAGKAAFQTSLAAGPHSITASFGGDTTSSASTSAASAVTVAPQPVPLSKPVFTTAPGSDGVVSRTATAGEAFSFTGLGATGNPSPTYDVSFTDGVGLPDGVTFTNGRLAGTSTLAGTWILIVTAKNSSDTAKEAIRLVVNPGSATGLQTVVIPGDGTTPVTKIWIVDADGTVTESTDTKSTPNATITAKQGDKLSLYVSPVDKFDNAIVTDDVTPPKVKSSVASDTFAFDDQSGGVLVTFNHASPHTISYTLDGLAQSFTVEVSALTPGTIPTVVPAALAYTGSNPATAAGLSGLLLAAGIALRLTVIVKRRKRA